MGTLTNENVLSQHISWLCVDKASPDPCIGRGLADSLGTSDPWGAVTTLPLRLGGSTNQNLPFPILGTAPCVGATHCLLLPAPLLSLTCRQPCTMGAVEAEDQRGGDVCSESDASHPPPLPGFTWNTEGYMRPSVRSGEC